MSAWSRMPVSIVALGSVARRSFWTLGKVALCAVVAHREPAPRGCDDGVPLWEVGRQALGGGRNDRKIGLRSRVVCG